MSTVVRPHSPATGVRLSSLDQFRGYTMLGMMLVNFLGGYAICPRILKHSNDYCSYADTIMPQFFFAVGFAMRLSLGKRFEVDKKMPWGRAVRRVLGLACVAVAWYTIVDLQRIISRFQVEPTGWLIYALFKGQYFQTLLHIAVTSLWILPVITASWRVRIVYAIASGILHFLLSWWFNYAWIFATPTSIDGGPLGFLTWCIPTICGTMACDAVRASGSRVAWRLALSGCAVMLLGWCISLGSTLYDVSERTASETSLDIARFDLTEATTREQSARLKKFPVDPVVPTLERLKAWNRKVIEPPFVPPPNCEHRRWNYWMMSQQSGNVAYPTFAAGLSLVIYSLFLWICDGLGFRVGLFRTLGTNSLAAYMLHDVAMWVVGDHFPRNSPSVAMTLTGFVLTSLFVYVFCRGMERLGWYVRV